ncbi:MAG: hypothetical protein RL536_310, partial [Candidatus Parcubacteria bacterium]
MKANNQTILSLMARIATRVGSLEPEEETITRIIKDGRHPFWTALDGFFVNVAPTEAEVK